MTVNLYSLEGGVNETDESSGINPDIIGTGHSTIVPSSNLHCTNFSIVQYQIAMKRELVYSSGRLLNLERLPVNRAMSTVQLLM